MKRFVFALLLVVALYASSDAAPSAYTFPVQATNGNDVQLGSAVLVQPVDGVYMTAYHTLQRVPGGTLSVKVGDMFHPVVIIGIYKKMDTVVFKGPAHKSLPALPIVLPGEKDAVQAAGYRPQLDVMTLRVTGGETREVSLWSLWVTAEGEPGMSGGGLFSKDGTKLHGLVTQMDKKTKQLLGVNADLMNFCLEVVKDRKENEVVAIDKLMPKG